MLLAKVPNELPYSTAVHLEARSFVIGAEIAMEPFVFVPLKSHLLLTTYKTGILFNMITNSTIPGRMEKKTEAVASLMV